MATTRRTTEFTAVPSNPGNRVGKKTRHEMSTFTVTAAGAAVGDIYILAGPFSVSTKLTAVLGTTGAMTSATSNDLGFYKRLDDGSFVPAITSGGAELWSAVDLTAAKTYQDLLFGLNTSIDVTKNIGDFLSLQPDTEPLNGVYLGFRTNVASTATTITNRMLLIIEEATTK